MVNAYYIDISNWYENQKYFFIGMSVNCENFPSFTKKVDSYFFKNQ